MYVDQELEAIAAIIVKHRFQIPVILLLQSLKPLSGCIAHLAQGLTAIPVLEQGVRGVGMLGKLLEISSDRQRVERLLQSIEAHSDSCL